MAFVMIFPAFMILTFLGILVLSLGSEQSRVHELHAENEVMPSLAS